MVSTQPELQLFGGGVGSARGRIFTIPPTAPFLDAMARAVLDGNLPREGGTPPSPAELSAYQIYLPNRATCRALAEAFLRVSDTGATLLPRIRPLGSAEEDALLLLSPNGEGGADERPDLPVLPGISALDRRMALTQLVLAWAKNLRRGRVVGDTALRIADTPAAAAELALELMRLMDEAETEGVDLRRMRELMPERFAAHEQLSLSFLGIVLEMWPAYLAERGLLNPVDRRNRIMVLETARLREARPETPIIIAGSTGSIPATAELMKVVLDLPAGAIVLPGLDLTLDEASWNSTPNHPDHPQAGLHHLLTGLNAARRDVAVVKGAEPTPGAHERLTLLNEAMRPAATVALWPNFTANADPAAIRESLAPVSLVAAPTNQDEAAAIALILREAMETPGKAAHLVTPDRALSRRVAAELGRWGLNLTPSGGEMLRATSAGIFHDLIAEAAATGSQISLLALLKHPLTRLGLPGGEAQTAARILEIAGMRQSWCGQGLDALAKSLDLAKRIKPRHRAIDRFSDEEWAAADSLLARLTDALRPLTRLARRTSVPFNDLAGAHAKAAEALGADETGSAARLLEAPGGEAMAALMHALAGEDSGPEIGLADYPAFFRSLIRLETTRPAAAHPRLQILAATDARLIAADLVVIAGLNEGTWPQAADPGPWLNRTMRSALGLPSPERRIRLAAHDFCQLMGAREVVLTRSLKSGGAPTVPSRWLMRIEALLQGLGLHGILAARPPWAEWSAARNTVALTAPAKPPAPCPPLDARPRRLSVSDIQLLITNPYAIYAKHVLELSTLNPLEAGPRAADRGQIIHDMLHRFARRYPGALPAECGRALLAIFDDCAALYGDHARISAFWRPRLDRFASWFEETEPARRGEATILTEVPGEMTFEAPHGPFTLRARADRIDLYPNGDLALYDYKSGAMPTDAAVAEFKAPQLPLEALIALDGHFDGLASKQVMKLAYISAKGGDPAGAERELSREPPGVLARAARKGLIALIERFDDAATPYTAMRRAAFSDSYRFDGYAHLARVAEWKGATEELQEG